MGTQLELSLRKCFTHALRSARGHPTHPSTRFCTKASYTSGSPIGQDPRQPCPCPYLLSPYLQPRTAAHPRLFSVQNCFSAWIRHRCSISLSTEFFWWGGDSFQGSVFICLLKTLCLLSGPHMLDEGPENLRTGFLPSLLTSSCEEAGLQQLWLLCKLRPNVPSRAGKSQLLVSTSHCHQRAPWALVGPKETWWHKSS